ncbi:MAG: hypothetical protein L0Z46_03225 [Nitrospiraceae bacterium]|nr:hypothetical protein [Nitrospiraceae bacterium]
MDPKLKKWIRWLKIIHDEIQQLVIAKDTFWEVQEIIKRNNKIQKHSSFYQYLGNTYVSHSVIGMRRQLKVDSQSISLARILTEMAETPDVISRKYYKGLYSGSVVEGFADGDFDKFSGPGAQHISKKMVLEDLKKLRDAGRKLEEYADQRVAHRDKREVKSPPLFRDGDAFIELLDKLYVKYHLLFHASSMDSLMPTYQYDWQEIFREPWIPPEPEESNESLNTDARDEAARAG